MKADTEFKVKFPCGYEYRAKTQVKSGVLDIFASFDMHQFDDDLPECPLHGQDCNRMGGQDGNTKAKKKK